MQSEQQQTAELDKLFSHPQLTQGQSAVKQLRIFIHSPQIWPRFRMAPASSALSKHHAYDGGLLDHCVDVAELAIKADPDIMVPRSSILMVAFLHDLHKIGNAAGEAGYIPNMIKDGTMRSDKVPYARNEQVNKFGAVQVMIDSIEISRLMSTQLSYLLSEIKEWPEGRLSLSLVSAFDPALYAMLTPDERFSIVHHAGMYDRQARNQLTGNETYLMMLMHFADMLSSRRRNWFGAKKEV